MSTAEVTMTLQELMEAALNARAEVARLERLVHEARAERKRIENELADHPEVEEDRAYFAGHLFEWGHDDGVRIWPCRYVPSPDETRSEPEEDRDALHREAFEASDPTRHFTRDFA